jgi:hypothetical protein
MKFTLFVNILISFSFYGFSQNELSTDEKVRKKLTIKYIEQNYFEYDSPKSEAMANLMINSFIYDLYLPPMNFVPFELNDKLKLEALYFALNKIINDSTLTWDELVNYETEHLIKEDKAVRRNSKYKVILKN